MDWITLYLEADRLQRNVKTPNQWWEAFAARLVACEAYMQWKQSIPIGPFNILSWRFMDFLAHWGYPSTFLEYGNQI